MIDVIKALPSAAEAAGRALHGEVGDEFRRVMLSEISLKAPTGDLPKETLESVREEIALLSKDQTTRKLLDKSSTMPAIFNAMAARLSRTLKECTALR